MAGNSIILICAIFTAIVSAQETGFVRRFIQITDFHLERGYVVGTDVRNRCVDRPLNPSQKADSAINRTSSKFGDFQCDTPQIIIDSAIKYMGRVVKDADFILWTGDNTAHFQGEIKDWTTIFSNMRTIGDKLRHFRTDGSETVLIPTLGNHDSSPSDFYKDFKKDKTAKRQYAGYLGKGGLDNDLKGRTLTEFGKCGYYSMRIRNMYEGNITQTFLVLNTNIYYHNKPPTDDDDPCDQLSWLDNQLKNSKDNERVFIVAHVLPGYFSLNPAYPNFSNGNHTRKYLDVITNKDNAKKIVAHFYGHLHTSEFRIFLGDENDVRGVGFVAPSISPLMFIGNGINPSFRVYEYNPVTREIVNFKQYYLPLQNVLDEQKSEKILSRRKEFPGISGDSEEEDEAVASSPGEFLTRGDEVEPSRRDRNSKFMKDPSISKREAIEVDDPNEQGKNDDDGASVHSEGVTLQDPAPKNVTTGEDGSNETTTPASNEIPVEKEDDSNQKQEDSSKKTDPDPVDTLVDKYWKEAFSAKDDLKINSLTKKQLYTAYLAMKHDRESEVFEFYFRDLTVLQPYGDCDKDCHAKVLCTMTNFMPEDMADCLQESGIAQHAVVQAAPFNTTTTTTTAMTTTALSDLTFTSQSSDSPNSVNEPGVITTPIEKANSSTPQKPTIEVPIGKERVDDPSIQGYRSSSVGKGIGIAIAIFSAMMVAVIGLWVYRRVRRNQYRSQEFLLTDSVFKYDGYSQVDQP